MRKKAVQVLFCGKISMELFMFKQSMLRQEPEDILASAYEIDSRITIYELLLEIYPTIPEEVLQVMLSFPNLLDYFYFSWMQADDLHMEELRECIWKSIAGLKKNLVMDEAIKNCEGGMV